MLGLSSTIGGIASTHKLGSTSEKKGHQRIMEAKNGPKMLFMPYLLFPKKLCSGFKPTFLLAVK